MSAFHFTVDKERKIVRATMDDAASAVASFTKKDWYVQTEMLVRLLVRGSEGYAGQMTLRLRSVADMNETSCPFSYAKLRPRLFHANKPIYRVSSSEIFVSAYRRQGYGALMYAAALVLADLQGTGIASDWCFGGATSTMAGRVWESRRFGEIADVDGDVAFLRRP